MYRAQNSTNSSSGASSSTSEGNGSLQYNMARSLTLTAQETLACRPMTSKKAYASKTNEFIKWANETFTDENELERSIVSGTKLNYFLRDQVLGRNSRQKSKVPTAPKKIKTSTLEQYIAVITDLYKTQVQKKINLSREKCEDRGEGTLADGYTSLDQVSKIVQFYLNGQRNHGENLRDALAFLFSHYFLLRGESIRNAELTDFQTINLDPESVRSDIKCHALVMILRQGKTNKNNHLELTGCIRSTQVEICPIMIFGLYLFWRFHVQNEPFPDFTTSENWYRIKLFKSSDSDTTKVWAYASHRDAVARGLEGAQIFTMKKTHINCGSAARMADLAEASVDPSESLCKMIFPDLDVWHDRLTAKQANPNNNDEMEVTVAAKAFFELLFMLRKTIIQDAVFMIEKFPTHPLWQNSLFSHELFIDYRERMLIVAQEDNDPVNALLQRCVPILEDKIKCMHHDLSTRLDTQSASQEKIIDYITRLVTGQASISLNISLPGGSGEDQDRTNITTTAIPQQSEPNSLSGNNSMDHSQTFHGNINSNGMPCYLMSRGIVSVNDLWREWTEGLCGGHAIKDLERRWGTRWRKEETEKKFFNRRRLIINEIERYASQNNITTRTAVDIAERRRSQKGYSLHSLSKNINKIFETESSTNPNQMLE
ncbi:hypothetical protein INT47_004736 [Mucor saturninus]|uniref:Transcription activator GCR1-like domain-containing protein n=1 Tax=Mucor saturninus TaxID=64648 RepID=A0A8H7QHW5_9FUNG|nr:hypothetical protein INT47_004736 [Mucor saturninus]